MQVNRKLQCALIFLLVSVSFSHGKEKVSERKLAKVELGVDPLYCQYDFIGAIEGSLLRLARENLTQLTVRWKQDSLYELNSLSSEINLKKLNGDLMEEVSGKDYISISLKEEARFIEKAALRKLPKNYAQMFLGKKTFIFQGPVKESGKLVDVFKWNFEYQGMVYSYSLLAPILDNRDLDNFYRPIVPHCSEEKIKDFKQKYKPLKFLWSTAGVPSAEQSTRVFNLLRE